MDTGQGSSIQNWGPDLLPPESGHKRRASFSVAQPIVAAFCIHETGWHVWSRCHHVCL